MLVCEISRLVCWLCQLGHERRDTSCARFPCTWPCQRDVLPQAMLKDLLAMTPAATVAFDAMSTLIAHPEGKIDTGDADLDHRIREMLAAIAGGRHIWPGGWDPAALAKELGYKVSGVS